MRISDWSSDVCSSDLLAARGGVERPHHAIARRGIENPVHRHRAGHRIAERQVDRPGQPQTAHRVAVDLVQRAVMLLAIGPPEGRPVRAVRPVEQSRRPPGRRTDGHTGPTAAHLPPTATRYDERRAGKKTDRTTRHRWCPNIYHTN